MEWLDRQTVPTMVFASPTTENPPETLMLCYFLTGGLSDLILILKCAGLGLQLSRDEFGVTVV
jgi:hypothetical protein